MMKQWLKDIIPIAAVILVMAAAAFIIYLNGNEINNGIYKEQVNDITYSWNEETETT